MSLECIVGVTLYLGTYFVHSVVFLCPGFALEVPLVVSCWTEDLSTLLQVPVNLHE